MYKGEEDIVAYLKDRQERTLEEIAAATRHHIDSVRRIVEDLKGRGLVEVTAEKKERIKPTEEFRQAMAEKTLPEFTVYEFARKNRSIEDIPAGIRSRGLAWAQQKGFVRIEKGKLVPAQSTEEVAAAHERLFRAYEQAVRGDIVEEKVLGELYRRKLLETDIQTVLRIQRTDVPYQETYAFDIATPSADAPIGKAHPLSVLRERIERIFAEMGFEPMEGNVTESAFWNFDALFQPQDHPARDLADTFYLNGEDALPEKKLVDRIRKAHEKGWKYRWDPAEAKRRVLRTHTTALSARHLAGIQDASPRKFFAIGKVFRNEATDYKHLTEFYQVEGIVVWEGATFGNLLGILKEFYRGLGFKKVRFRPSYFPYTEPSLEVEVYFEPKKEWLELGGAGIFRPEVSLPLCNRYPVLAWGLSLERLLLMQLNIEDIRELYRNDADFLRKVIVP